MKYVILKQFIPGLDQIWVSKLDEADPVYAYDTYAEAEVKLLELQAVDPGRGYKIDEMTVEQAIEL